MLVEDLDEAADRCVARAATRVSGRCGDALGDFIVLCGPEGNEFYVVATRRCRLCSAREDGARLGKRQAVVQGAVAQLVRAADS